MPLHGLGPTVIVDDVPSDVKSVPAQVHMGHGMESHCTAPLHGLGPTGTVPDVLLNEVKLVTTHVHVMCHCTGIHFWLV